MKRMGPAPFVSTCGDTDGVGPVCVATTTSAAPDPAGDAAVDVQLGARHPVGLVGRQVDERVGVVHRLAEAAEGMEVLGELPRRGRIGLAEGIEVK